MSRGRGFSRGSFRGRGGGDGWGNEGGSSRGRGFSGPSRGRFNWYKEHSSFESRSRYPSGSGMASERYSSRGRGEDGGYRRYSRMDGPSYSSRDHSHHRSPESHRKRLRTEQGYVQASSSRRSHEGSYGGGNDYSNRYGYEEKGGYADERGRGYREERRSSSGFRDRSREDYPHRKSDQLESSMPPPSSAPPRHVSSPRGSFRGRIGRGRGMSRMIFSRKDSMISKRRSLMDSSYSFRKRLLAARSQAENIRRLKLQRLRRLKEAALSAKKESGEKDGSKTTEEISEEEKDANWDEDVEKLGEENSGVKFLKDVSPQFLAVIKVQAQFVADTCNRFVNVIILLKDKLSHSSYASFQTKGYGEHA
ncbi:hypothetical protein L9F63_015809 [Diploptera punctata]|uniref:Uncharacterized protein n=1 Tax=Diploptera punctata TaxID=6984 RepID=A0AAD8A4Z1_DIPPU|nr:hypothetical protein L9F63_015809 [Diploptera punctata]